MSKFFGLLLIIFLVFMAFVFFRWIPTFFGSWEVSPSISSVEESTIEEPKESSSEYSFQESLIQQKSVQKEAKVIIDWVSPKGFFKKYSEIQLSASLPVGQKINISGWKIKNNKDFLVIPQGDELYSSKSSPSDIYLKDGDQVSLYSHSNRLNANFRLNKCMGYFQDLEPENPLYCPPINHSEITSFSGLCQDYILSLGNCEVPSFNPPVPFNDGACRDFLSKLNYSGCVEKYRRDEDFFDNKWRIWLTTYNNQESDFLDPYHDKIQLIDKTGKIIDEYIY